LFIVIVKKLNRNSNYDSVSLIDKNGSFRGEARFESGESKLKRYIEEYKGRINDRLMAEGKAKTRLKLQVFELDNKSIIEEKKRKYGTS
jgi:hypothetical protein